MFHHLFLILSETSQIQYLAIFEYDYVSSLFSGIYILIGKKKKTKTFPDDTCLKLKHLSFVKSSLRKAFCHILKLIVC